MRVTRIPGRPGVVVWLDPEECDVYLRLVEDAEKAGLSGESSRLDFVMLSLSMGTKIDELFASERLETPWADGVDGIGVLYARLRGEPQTS